MAKRTKKPTLSQPLAPAPSLADFDEVLRLIEAARGRAFSAFRAASGDYDLAASLALSQEPA